VATHRISILNGATRFDGSNKISPRNYANFATNDVWKQSVIVIDEDGTDATQLSTRVGMFGSFEVPQNYVGSPVIIPLWTSTKTSGDCVWDFEYRAVGGDDAESLDQSGTQESVSVTDAAPTAANRRLTPSLSLTAANLSPGDIVEFFFGADGTDGSDTLAGARIIFAVAFQYSDT
jgi:hypothetical protein